MRDTDHPDPDGLSRRHLLAGLGTVAGAGGLLAAAPGGSIALAHPLAAPADFPQALGPTVTGLTYLPIDATAFHGAESNTTRLLDDFTGVGIATPPGWIAAPLSLPEGSVIRRLDISYQVQPIISIWRRPYGSNTLTEVMTPTTLAIGGGPKSQTLTTNVTIGHGASYQLRVFCSAGDSIYGVTVGYQPPTQGFIPFAGATPRVYDTRQPATGGKLNANEERTVNLGNPGVRGAVVNLTLANTEGPSGFVAVFPANIAWPGNSSQNWFAANAQVANAVITAVDATSSIKIRGGENRTHVIIDRIGWLA